MAQKATRQRNGGPVFDNATDLDDRRLRRMCLEAVSDWRMDGAAIRVRYSRSADFSGTCYYRTGQIYVNLGRHLRYPYRLGTHLARARSDTEHWWKPVYTIELADGYQVVLFVFLHECFHLLVKRARRNPRQKESMCDRFAARVLSDRYGAVVRDQHGQPVGRPQWDFQDLDRFIAAARRTSSPRPPRHAPGKPSAVGSQLLLFPLDQNVGGGGLGNDVFGEQGRIVG